MQRRPRGWRAWLRWSTPNTDAATSNTRRQNLLATLSARLADHFVCVSDDCAVLRSNKGCQRIASRTIGNGIDLRRFPFAGPCRSGPAVTVARLCPDKDLVDAFGCDSDRVPRQPEFRLWVAGDWSVLAGIGAARRSTGPGPITCGCSVRCARCRPYCGKRGCSSCRRFPKACRWRSSKRWRRASRWRHARGRRAGCRHRRRYRPVDAAAQSSGAGVGVASLTWRGHAQQ